MCTFYAMDLGSRLKAARLAAGYSQSKLSELCGWEAPSRLANYEQGTREPTLADLRLIASKVAPGGYTLARILLGDEAAPIVPRLTAANVMDAARIVSVSLPTPRKLDPSDPTDAQMLASTLAAVVHKPSPEQRSDALPPFEGLEAYIEEGGAEDSDLKEKVRTQQAGQYQPAPAKSKKVSTRNG